MKYSGKTCVKTDIFNTSSVPMKPPILCNNEPRLDIIYIIRKGIRRRITFIWAIFVDDLVIRSSYINVLYVYHFKGIFKGNNFYLVHFLQSHQFHDEKAKKPILGHYNLPVGGGNQRRIDCFPTGNCNGEWHGQLSQVSERYHKLKGFSPFCPSVAGL